jgi:hypothetical protein
MTLQAAYSMLCLKSSVPRGGPEKQQQGEPGTALDFLQSRYLRQVYMSLLPLRLAVYPRCSFAPRVVQILGLYLWIY